LLRRGNDVPMAATMSCLSSFLGLTHRMGISGTTNAWSRTIASRSLRTTGGLMTGNGLRNRMRRLGSVKSEGMATSTAARRLEMSSVRGILPLEGSTAAALGDCEAVCEPSGALVDCSSLASERRSSILGERCVSTFNNGRGTSALLSCALAGSCLDSSRTDLLRDDVLTRSFALVARVK
jgi:hypothetical protein